MRILIGAGGTGGHVYPALAVMEALLDHDPDRFEIDFVGSVGGFERPLVEQANLPFRAYHEVYAGPIHGVGFPRVLISVIKIMIGIIQSLWFLLRRRPQSILLTGGWVNVPVALAAWVTRTPILVYLPDIEPGLTIRGLRYFARKVAITAPESAKYFGKDQTIVTGYPVRRDRLEVRHEDSVAHFGLDESRLTLLVFGGSRGAKSINTALIQILPELLEENLQVIHITGTHDWERIQKETASLGNATHYHPFSYLHEDMALAFAAADIVVSRSGASTLGEFPLFGIAAILVPYPYAWRYQKVNADYLVERGAGVYLPDEKLSSDLLQTIHDLMHHPDKLQTMQNQAEALATADSSTKIAKVLVEIEGGEQW